LLNRAKPYSCLWVHHDCLFIFRKSEFILLFMAGLHADLRICTAAGTILLGKRHIRAAIWHIYPPTRRATPHLHPSATPSTRIPFLGLFPESSRARTCCPSNLCSTFYQEIAASYSLTVEILWRPDPNYYGPDRTLHRQNKVSLPHSVGLFGAHQTMYRSQTKKPCRAAGHPITSTLHTTRAVCSSRA
jgi:hypothetical protein